MKANIQHFFYTLQDNTFKYFAITLVVAWLFLFALIPQLGVLFVAFLKNSPNHLLELSFSLDSFKRLIDPIFLQILFNSLILSTLSTGICLLFGYPFAYGLATAKESLRPILLLLIIIPFWTNSVIRIYALILFLKKNGIVSGILEFLHFIDSPISLLYGNFAIFTGFLYTLLPFMVLPIYVSIEKLDKRLYDAARDLGASPIRTFIHIILPLTMPGILAGCILVFLPTLTYFFIPEILGGARTILIGNFIKNQFLITRDWPLGALASTVLTGILLLLILVYKRTQRKTSNTSTMEELQ